MGIGNVSRRPVPHHAGNLITPHGDWKPAPPSARRRRRREILITPHGDWKLTEIAISVPLTGTSLPLMGIGNARRTTMCRRAGRTSLPLMGIGNQRRHRSTRAGVNCSLPLMGIGNPAGIGLSGVRPVALITPHGDWKPDNVVEAPPDDLTSLPLMGIGNTDKYYIYNGSNWLITPHGDWKQRRSCFGLRDVRCDSLPLMGIGNFTSPPLIVLGSLLITPHGDWKLHQPAADCPGISAHYPSWGLETAGQSQAARSTTRSLPLMGIGNVVNPIRVAAVPDLITLMGIGNPPGAGLTARTGKLITPHGDWKPRPT